MATHTYSPMSGGSGSEITIVADDATGAVRVEMGNDRGSPLVRMGATLADGTEVGPFEANARTQRTIEYDDPDEVQPKLPIDLPAEENPGVVPKPKAPANETLIEEPAEKIDVLDSQGRVIRKRLRQVQRFRAQQAIPTNDRAKVTFTDVLDGNGDPTGDKQVEFIRTYRQEVY